MAMVAIDWDPQPKQLRQFAWIGSAVLLLLAGWRIAEDGWSSLPAMLLGCGGLLAAVGVSQPHRLRHVYIAAMVATYPIGWVMSHVILSLIYFGVFTPVALAFRIAGRDPLERRFEREAATYWRPKRRTTNMRRYLRQY
jgi:hypothetical protein